MNEKIQRLKKETKDRLQQIELRVPQLREAIERLLNERDTLRKVMDQLEVNND
jgi:predicted  nucleic acid-binding Zn-ribbon protein